MISALEDRESFDKLFSLVYEELRGLAANVLRSELGNHLTPTTLVHEAWLKMANTPELAQTSKLHFRRIAARAMRQVLVEAAAQRGAARRSAVARNLRRVATRRSSARRSKRHPCIGPRARQPQPRLRETGEAGGGPVLRRAGNERARGAAAGLRGDGNAGVALGAGLACGGDPPGAGDRRLVWRRTERG